MNITDTPYQDRGYFGLLGIGNVGNNVIPNPLVVSYLQNLAGDPQQVQNIYYRVRSNMISKAIEGSITKIYYKRLRLH